MSTLRLVLAISAVAALCQCESAIGPVDSRNPTIDQQDALDVQWGLAPRKTKGSPRRIIPVGVDAAMGAAAGGVPTTSVPRIADQTTSPAPAAVAPAGAATAAPAAPVAVDPSVLQKLR
jgi:hypothetical protein